MGLHRNSIISMHHNRKCGHRCTIIQITSMHRIGGILQFNRINIVNIICNLCDYIQVHNNIQTIRNKEGGSDQQVC